MTDKVLAIIGVSRATKGDCTIEFERYGVRLKTPTVDITSFIQGKESVAECLTELMGSKTVQESEEKAVREFIDFASKVYLMGYKHLSDVFVLAEKCGFVFEE